MRAFYILILVSSLAACESKDPDPVGPEPGSEGGPCYGNGTCDEPLTCVGGYCVPLDEPDAGSDVGQDEDVVGPEDAAPQDIKVEDTAADTCVDPDDCENGSQEEVVCGYNSQGTIGAFCEDGAWVTFGACDDDDVCFNGDQKPQSCGINGDGVELWSCEDGQWALESACEDSDVCANGENKVETCGLNDAGEQPFTCEGGQWLELGACENPDACKSGTEISEPCGEEGTMVVTCVDGAWKEGPCKDGDPDCPVAKIQVLEGEEVIPQTKLHLSGSESFAWAGDILKYEWDVKQPPGSQSVFSPDKFVAEPTFEVNVAGSYVFTLRVWDGEDTPSCVDAEYQVIVNPDEAIHIELIWWTENDPDQTDGTGTDLDLHFLHQFAAGQDFDGDGVPDGWFDNPFDCFWFNANPNWGSQDPTLDDDPSLDRDDSDGAGPENLNLNLPEEGMEYRVGVHYFKDNWDMGPSLATVRVYIMSVLVFEVADVELVNGDMWYVGTVHWPSGDVLPITDAGGGYHIIPNYPSAF